MSSFPPFLLRLEMPTAVTTQAARDRYVFMAALCCPSPWYEVAPLKLGQNSHRNRVPEEGHEANQRDHAVN